MTKKIKKEMSIVKKDNTKFSKVPAVFNADQLLTMLQRTPANHIFHRPGKGGSEFAYVTGTYVKKVLNYVFGWRWDFEVKSHGDRGGLIWVLGRLTIKNKSNVPVIIKEQFGRAEIKYKKGSKEELDYGNDLKAATTDALKKCAAELGIASDIYGKNEFKEIAQEDKGFVQPDADDDYVQEVAVVEEKPDSEMIKKLKDKLTGATDEERLTDLKAKTGITLNTLKITDKHASILITEIMRAEVKNTKGGANG